LESPIGGCQHLWDIELPQVYEKIALSDNIVHLFTIQIINKKYCGDIAYDDHILANNDDTIAMS